MESPQEFTNRELAILINSLTDKFDSYHIETIDRLVKIEAQTTKTNGRVNKLENWRSGIVAVIAFIGFLIPLILTYAHK